MYSMNVSFACNKFIGFYYYLLFIFYWSFDFGLVSFLSGLFKRLAMAEKVHVRSRSHLQKAASIFPSTCSLLRVTKIFSNVLLLGAMVKV